MLGINGEIIYYQSRNEGNHDWEIAGSPPRWSEMTILDFVGKLFQNLGVVVFNSNVICSLCGGIDLLWINMQLMSFLSEHYPFSKCSSLWSNCMTNCICMQPSWWSWFCLQSCSTDIKLPENLWLLELIQLWFSGYESS